MQYTSNNIRLSQLILLTQTKYELGRKFVYDLIIRQTHSLEFIWSQIFTLTDLLDSEYMRSWNPHSSIYTSGSDSSRLSHYLPPQTF